MGGLSLAVKAHQGKQQSQPLPLSSLVFPPLLCLVSEEIDGISVPSLFPRPLSIPSLLLVSPGSVPTEQGWPDLNKVPR